MQTDDEEIPRDTASRAPFTSHLAGLHGFLKGPPCDFSRRVELQGNFIALFPAISLSEQIKYLQRKLLSILPTK
jgi:hypothetical protein